MAWCRPTAEPLEAPVEEEPQEAPPAPQNLTATVNGSITLTWDAPDDNSVTGYQIPAAAARRGRAHADGVRRGHPEHGHYLDRHQRHGGGQARLPGQGHQRGGRRQAVQLRQPDAVISG